MFSVIKESLSVLILLNSFYLLFFLRQTSAGILDK
jgi:hypothetical protein